MSEGSASPPPAAESSAVSIVVDPVTRMKCESCGCAIDVSAFNPFDTIRCPECDKEAVVPARLGPFLLLRLINTGGMGGVYHALDESLGRHVAIKVMLKSLGEDLAFVEDFRREAQAAAKLNHPHVAQIYSFGQEKGQPYIVMELVSGKRFDKMIEDAGEKGLSQALVMQIGLDIAEGLKAGDEIGLIHGDIKPENILLDEKMQAKLVDFGIAQVEGQKQTAGVWGTPYYIAPEKLKGKKSDARSDIYNLGATLFHALAGRPPFEGETPVEVVKARLDHEAPNLRKVRPDINKTVADTIARMLEPEPAMRHPTYASLIGDMKRALTDIAPKGGEAAVRGEGRKVLIRKRPRSGALTAAPGTAETAPSAGKIRMRTPPHAPLIQAQPEQKARSPRAALTVVLLIMLAGGLAVLGYHLKQRRDESIQARRRAYLLKTEIESIGALAGRIEVEATNIVKLAARADPFVAATRKAARTVVGDALDGYDLAPRVPPPESPAGQDATAESEAEGAGTPDEERAAAETPASQPQDTPGTPAEMPQDKAPRVPGDEPEIVTLLREVLTQAAILATAADTAGRIAADAGSAQEEAARQTDIAAVTEKRAGLEAQISRLAAVKDEASQALQQAAAAAEKAREIELAFLKDQAEKQRLEKEKEKEEERLRLIAREKQRAEATDKELRPVIAAGNYQEAIETVRGEIDGYRTEEAKAILEALADRYKHLVELRAFLIHRLNAEPYRWGWLRASIATEDVLGADEDGVRLKGRTVPWAEVSTAQYIRFIEHYLPNAKMKRSVKAGHYLAAAIYCYENGGAEAAQVYLRKALDVAPYLREESQRVLPLPSDGL